MTEMKMYALLYSGSEETEVMGVYTTREAAIETIAIYLYGTKCSAWDAYLDTLVTCALEERVAPKFGAFLVGYLAGQDDYRDYSITSTYAYFGA